MLSQKWKVFKHSFSQVEPCSFINRYSCHWNFLFLEEGLEVAKPTEGLLFRLQMLPYFLQLGLHFLLGLALILRHVFYFDFKSNILGFDRAAVFAFLQIVFIWKCPS